MSKNSLFTPLENTLPGMVLKERWLVGKTIGKGLHGSTGGCFSITFECTDQHSAKSVFLKVVDVIGATQRYSDQMEVADILVKIGEEHKFESFLMDECAQARMSRVVVCLDHGAVTDLGFRGPVLFLVFELAKGDAHKIRSTTPSLADSNISDKWWLETLHHVAVGLNQLHQRAIAHQDVKPSNVLFFEKRIAKVADLGRAVKRGVSSSNLNKNGDIQHSPPELFYGYRPAEWATRYFSTDLYMLGNLLYIHFSGGETATASLFSHLEWEFIPEPYGPYNGTFNNVLPALEEAFGRIVIDFRNHFVMHLPENVAEQLTTIFTCLCQPNPEKRGDPKDHQTKYGRRFSVERFINRFRRARLLLP